MRNPGSKSSDRSHLEFKTENICEIISKAIQLAQYRIGEKNIAIIFKNEGEQWHTNISANRIEQVLLNIIFNAIDAINERKLEIPSLKGEISIRINNSENYSTIEISDNGIGINKYEINNIFDPFFTTKKVGSGTGLGLSVCYQIVIDHNGKIWVESQQGQGATFFIQLPKIRI